MASARYESTACIAKCIALWWVLFSVNSHAEESTEWPPDALPMWTHTSTGKQGDPLNVAVCASEPALAKALAQTGWYPADHQAIFSVMREVIDIGFKRSYPFAPVSGLFLFGRKQDWAFEKPVGFNPRHRHHVRFWKSNFECQGKPVWIGAATFDIGVKVFKFSHRIAPDIDAERDLLMLDLDAITSQIDVAYSNGIGLTHSGVNGEGDHYFSDGRLAWIAINDL